MLTHNSQVVTEVYKSEELVSQFKFGVFSEPCFGSEC